MASLTTAVSALMANAAQYEFTHQASWKPLRDGIDAEKVSAALQAYPKLDVAMDVITQSVIAIMAPHLPSEGQRSFERDSPTTTGEQADSKVSAKEL